LVKLKERGMFLRFIDKINISKFEIMLN
jgi:hypothetical protein